MDGRIGHLHCRYHVIGEGASASALTVRLERVAQAGLAEAWAAALDQSLGDDSAVYVLRHLRVGLVVSGADLGLADEPLASRWAERLAGAVVRGIAAGPNDGTALIRFEDQADFVVHFIVDLLAGRAWERWFYGAFAPLRDHGPVEALWAVLDANREHLPAILGRLQREGALERLLACLDPAVVVALWTTALGAAAIPAPLPTRPLFASALSLADELGLWAGTRPASAALFEAYLAAAPPPADWRDRRELAAAVADGVRFMLARGYLRRIEMAETDALRARLGQAVRDLDWLDAGWLESSLLNLLAGPAPAPPGLPTRPANAGATPRQRELLAKLAALLRDGDVSLDGDGPDSPTNALRMYAALVARAPRWAGDAAATGLIQRLLAAWALLVRQGPPGEALRRLRRGETSSVQPTLAESHRAEASGVVDFVARLGEPALSLLETLSGVKGQGRGQAGMIIETDCAGVFLLLRAILDARLAGLADHASYLQLGSLSPLKAMLLALGLRWVGQPGAPGGQIDAGLGAFAGMDSPPPLDALRSWWAEQGQSSQERFQAGLLRVLAGQRLMDGATLHLHKVPSRDGQLALVAGDGLAGVWPLGQVVDATPTMTRAPGIWLAAWKEATGLTPVVIGVDTSGELESEHEADRQKLLAALSTLEGGRLDLPGPDLAVALTALALLRVWARWLRQFSASSPAYLLDQFIRRSGSIHLSADRLLVELEPRPLDVVLEMAGYLAELESVPWLGNRRLILKLRGHK